MKPNPCYPTLCIPKVELSTTDYTFIENAFAKLNWGEIEYINVVPSKSSGNDNKTCKVFIKFKRWYTSCDASWYRNRIINNLPVNIVYNAPWFWKIKMSYY